MRAAIATSTSASRSRCSPPSDAGVRPARGRGRPRGARTLRHRRSRRQWNGASRHGSPTRSLIAPWLRRRPRAARTHSPTATPRPSRVKICGRPGAEREFRTFGAARRQSLERTAGSGTGLKVALGAILAQAYQHDKAAASAATSVRLRDAKESSWLQVTIGHDARERPGTNREPPEMPLSWGRRLLGSAGRSTATTQGAIYIFSSPLCFSVPLGGLSIAWVYWILVVLMLLERDELAGSRSPQAIRMKFDDPSLRVSAGAPRFRAGRLARSGPRVNRQLPPPPRALRSRARSY